MPSLKGVISDKLRRLMTTDQILNNPHPDRSASPTKKPPRKGVDGRTVTGRKKK